MKRETRYTVFKNKDLDATGLTDRELDTLAEICNKVNRARAARGKAPLECVVVEHDWPEYEPTWAAIAARIDRGPETMTSITEQFRARLSKNAADFDGIVASILAVLDEQEQRIADLRRYLISRRKTVEASIAAEHLAGNEHKEACERTALTELEALERSFPALSFALPERVAVLQEHLRVKG